MNNEPSRIERVIAAISPMWALRREAARTALASHRGGVQTRHDSPWPTSTSYMGGTALERINKANRRSRARKVYNENPIGRSLLKTEVDNVVSSGFTLQARTESKEFNAEVEDRWEEWLEVADIRGMLSGVDLIRKFYMSPRRDGDGGIVLVDKGGESRLQYIPGDLIQSPYGNYAKPKGGPTIIDGIEVDGASRPVAFHIAIKDELKVREPERISANNFIYLAPEIDEDLGLRGDSCYSTIFPLLNQIDSYIEAVIIAARMGAVFGLIFKEETSPTQFNALGTLANSQARQQKAVTLENGIAKYIGNKDDVVQVQAQQPMQQTPDFIRAMARLLGLPFDMPLELVLKDVSQVNFSSARVGLLGYYRACRARQKAFKARCLSRIFRWWISREVKMQRFVSAAPVDFWTHRFMSEGWDYTDPVSEIQADLLQVAMGTKTLQMVAAEHGRDFEEMTEDQAVARMMRRLKNLPEVTSTMTRDVIDPADKRQLTVDLSKPEPADEDE